MKLTRRELVAAGIAVASGARAAPPPLPDDAAALWTRLFAAPPGESFAWWFEGTLFAHVDRLREFPVAGWHAVMVARGGSGGTLDFRTIGCFSDFMTGLPTARWANLFTGGDQAIPAVFGEGPGRYALTSGPSGPTLTLTARNVRTNRTALTVDPAAGRATLTQIEATLQGWPGLDGALPPLDSPAVTERQTRLQLIHGGAAAGGYFTHVYDALPPWLGFGEALGSGLAKGQMRRARTDEVVNAAVWRHLKTHLPAAFAGDRLRLP